VFLFAAVIKAADPPLFVEQITGYQLSPESLSPLLARFFLVAEFGIGLALIVNFRPRFTIPLATGVMLLFIVVLVWAAISGNTGECGCFGRVAERSVGGGIVEDIVFVALGVLAWLTLRHGHRGRGAWQLGCAVMGLALGLVAPAVTPAMDVGHLVTSARPGGRFDHIVVEEFDGDIERGEYLVAILDPASPRSAEAVDALSALADDETLPDLVGVFQGDSESMVQFLFEHGAVFDGMGHAPRAGLRRFYRRLPVVLALRDAEMLAVWHEKIPTAASAQAAF